MVTAGRLIGAFSVLQNIAMSFTLVDPVDPRGAQAGAGRDVGIEPSLFDLPAARWRRHPDARASRARLALGPKLLIAEHPQRHYLAARSRPLAPISRRWRSRKSSD
jgi:hypothetical protein